MSDIIPNDITRINLKLKAQEEHFKNVVSNNNKVSTEMMHFFGFDAGFNYGGSSNKRIQEGIKLLKKLTQKNKSGNSL